MSENLLTHWDMAGQTLYEIADIKARDAIKLNNAKQTGLLKNSNLMDIFGTTDLTYTFNFAKAHPEAICPGDYIILPDIEFNNTIIESPKIRLASITNPYFGLGERTNPNGYVWEFANCIFIYKLNEEDTNIGNYINTNLFNLLNNEVFNALQEILGNIRIRSLNKAYPISNLNEFYNEENIKWVNEYLFLPSEIEILGQSVFNTVNNSGISTKQFDIYKLNSFARIKKFENRAVDWWLSTPSWNFGNKSFSCIKYNGLCSKELASKELGISPVFII